MMRMSLFTINQLIQQSKPELHPQFSPDNRKGFSTPNMQVAQRRLQHVRATCDSHDYKYLETFANCGSHARLPTGPELMFQQNKP
jgi:hypothetical protein